MPIRMKIDHARRFVEAVAEGEISLEDIEEFLDAVLVAEALTYRKLFDGRTSYGKYNDEEIMRLAARISAYSSLGQRGALALVTPAKYYEVAARFLNLDRPERPGRIFLDADEARIWLNQQPDVKD